MNAFSRWASSGMVLCGLLAFGNARAHIWIDKGVATGSHTDGNANEGTSVAMWGDLLVVGAPNLDKPAFGLGSPPVTDAGGVQIYRRNAGTWLLDQTIFAPTPTTGTRFGAAVTIDDDVIVVGEPYYTPSSNPTFVHNGRALVYVYSSTAQKFIYQKEIFRLGLTYPTYEDPSYRRPEYGSSVDVVHGSDNHFAVAVGAPGEDVWEFDDLNDNGWGYDPDEGVALVVRFYVDEAGTILPQDDTKNSWFITTPDHSGADIYSWPALFGSSIAISRATCPTSLCDDEYYLVVGAPNAYTWFVDEDSENGGYGRIEGGNAWLYRIDSSTNDAAPIDIHQEQTIVDSVDPPIYLPMFLSSTSIEGHSYEYFGATVDVRIIDSEAQVIIGAPRARAVLNDSRPGAVFYFKKDTNSCCWRRFQAIYAPNPIQPEFEEAFGSSVYFSDDRLLIGAARRQHIVNSQLVQSGSLFDFLETGIGASTWSVGQELYHDGLAVGTNVAGSPDWIAAGVPEGHGVTTTWQRGWMLNVTEPTNGIVQILPPFFPISQALNCPPDCSIPLENGRHLQPAALADDGYSFFNWEGAGCDDVETNSCPIVMDSDKSLTANFIINVGNTRTLNVSIAEGSGTVSVDAGEGNDLSCPGTCNGVYANGTSMYIQAVPAEGFEFVGWAGACGASNPCSFLLNTNVNLTATFRPVAGNHMVTVDFLDSGSGRVTLFSDEPPYVCDSVNSTCSASRSQNSEISLYACAHAFSEFHGWGGSTCWGAGSCDFILETDKQVSAVFSPSDVFFRNSFEETVCGVGEF